MHICKSYLLLNLSHHELTFVCTCEIQIQLQCSASLSFINHTVLSYWVFLVLGCPSLCFRNQSILSAGNFLWDRHTVLRCCGFFPSRLTVKSTVLPNAYTNKKIHIVFQVSEEKVKGISPSFFSITVKTRHGSHLAHSLTLGYHSSWTPSQEFWSVLPTDTPHSVPSS